MTVVLGKRVIFVGAFAIMTKNIASRGSRPPRSRTGKYEVLPTSK